MSVHACIYSGKLIFQRFDNNTEAFSVLVVREVKAVTFCHQHRNQLTASHYYRSEELTILIWQRPDKTFPLRMSVDDSAICASTLASIRSVFARYPMARAKSRACQGLTTATEKPSAWSEQATAASSPPVASIRTCATECFLSASRMVSKPSESLLTVN